MADVERYATELIELIDMVDEFKRKAMELGGGTWGIRELLDSYLSMFERFCPYKIGDRVELVRDITPHSDSGWYNSRHCLIVGARATIMNREYHNNEFVFHVTFDGETWIDSEGVERPVQNKRWFHFPESDFKKVEG